jgi:rRNA maturation RNase YbeY
MAITYITENVNLPKQFKKRQLSKWIKEVIRTREKKTGDIAYIFCNDKKILQINTQYLKHKYYTDIITFDYTEGNTVSGDIFISMDTVRSNAIEFDVSFEQELYRVMIHGILHLCGINDKTAIARMEMERAENEALDKLSF